MTIEIDRSFTQYLYHLKEELNKDPTNFIPKYHNKSTPYRLMTPEQKRRFLDTQKRWRDNNPERYKALMKRSQERNKYKIMLKRIANRDKTNAYCRERYRKNAEKERAYRRELYRRRKSAKV